MIIAAIDPDQSIVLEIGPGPTNKISTMLAKQAGSLYGLDIDERARTNPALSKALIYDGGDFPIQNEEYDIVIADYVMEHVQDPQHMLHEIHRVLRPGGQFIFRAPNVFLYVSLIARLTPHWVHLHLANRARGKEESEVDPYPTFFRFNTVRQIQTIAKQSAFNVKELRLVEKQPSYLKFNQWAFRVGILYERTINAMTLLASLRANISGILYKNTEEV